ncbi:MAG TPA: efflux RND transporter permease subunit, partial [Agitococcus sp.]|nr:efflux RND transporter permease subunit [Agitococcus sp.]
MGISGKLSRFFLRSQLTPLLAVIAFLLGLFALAVTPREEEPQIDVTMANVMIPFMGAKASDVERLVAVPAEQVLSQIQGIEHVYSVSKPNMALLTVQFKVGVARNEAIVRLYEAINNNKDWLNPQLGVGEPLIKTKGIDDVPILSLTLWQAQGNKGAYDLGRIAHSIEVELKRVSGTR